MKSTTVVIFALLSLSLGAVEPQSLKHFASVPPQAKMAFTRFCLGQYGGVLFENTEKDFELLATAPGLTSALIEVAGILEAEQEWDGFTHAWGLIAQRTDATASDQIFVRNKLNELLNRNTDPGGSAFKLSGLSFLGLYPSKENEKLLIRYLSDTNGGQGGDATDIAAESLGKIGTAASMEALRTFAEKRKPPPGNKCRYYETAVAALDQIKARIKAAPRSTKQLPGSAAQQPRLAKQGEKQPAPSSEEPSSTPWSVVAVMIVAAIGLLWLLIKRRM